MTLKAMFFWIVGSILVLSGAWIVGNLEFTIGVGAALYGTMLAVSFVLIMMGGLCWIYVSKREIK